MKILISAVLSILALNANAAVIDTVQISASGISVGGGTLQGNLNRLLQVPEGATVNGFTVTLLGSSAFNPQLELVQTFDPFLIGVTNLFGIGNPTFLTSANGSTYDTMLGLIDGSSVPFPEAIRVAFPNDGQTSVKFADIQISATGELAVIPVPAAVWLFGSGLIGLVGLARRKANA